MAEREDALARLRLLASADSRPVLTTDELNTILDAHPLPDVDGLTRSDGMAWTPKYDIIAAVAEAWGVKAGKVAGDFTFSADGASYDKGEVIAHCLAMEQKYAAMIAGSAPLGTATLDPLHGVIVNG